MTALNYYVKNKVLFDVWKQCKRKYGINEYAKK